jgi:hypothetical protein
VEIPSATRIGRLNKFICVFKPIVLMETGPPEFIDVVDSKYFKHAERENIQVP